MKQPTHTLFYCYQSFRQIKAGRLLRTARPNSKCHQKHQLANPAPAAPHWWSRQGRRPLCCAGTGERVIDGLVCEYRHGTWKSPSAGCNKYFCLPEDLLVILLPVCPSFSLIRSRFCSSYDQEITSNRLVFAGLSLPFDTATVQDFIKFFIFFFKK